jgi:hypothetical protein
MPVKAGNRAEMTLRLSGRSRVRHAVVLRRHIKVDRAVVDRGDPQQLPPSVPALKNATSSTRTPCR